MFDQQNLRHQAPIDEQTLMAARAGGQAAYIARADIARSSMEVYAERESPVQRRCLILLADVMPSAFERPIARQATRVAL
jgi:hypothetical protein